MRRAWLLIGLLFGSMLAQTAPEGLHVYKPRIDWETPSWGDYLARSAEESAHPELWPRWAWLMSMGPTGLRLHPASGGVGGAVSSELSWTHNALVYPGTADFVTLDQRVSFSGAFTLVARSNVEHSSYYGNICGGSDGSQWRKNNNSGGDGPMRLYTAGTGAAASSTTIPSDTDVELAVTRDGGNTVNYYYNGKPDGSGGSLAGTFALDYVGNAYYIANRAWYGKIYHLCVYDKALSPQQIAQLHADPYCWLRPRKRTVAKSAAAGAYILEAAAGSYGITGSPAALLADRIINLLAGSYSQTGSQAGLSARRAITAGPGAYSKSGQAAGVIADRVIPALPGSYAKTGSNAGTLASRLISLSPGSYTQSGSDAALAALRLIAANPGGYAITGASATLEYSPSATTYVLSADPGIYALTGSSAQLAADRLLNAQPGEITVTGPDAAVLAARVISAAVGSYGLTGTDSAIQAARILAADPGSYQSTGVAVTLSWSGAPEAPVVVKLVSISLSQSCITGVTLAQSRLTDIELN